MTSDFKAKLEAARLARVSNASKAKYTELERAKNVRDYSELNDWEEGFIDSIIIYLSKANYSMLSVKQAAKLAFLENRDGLSIYKDSDDSVVIKPAPLVSSANSVNSITNMDDDIPF